MSELVRSRPYCVLRRRARWYSFLSGFTLEPIGGPQTFRQRAREASQAATRQMCHDNGIDDWADDILALTARYE